MEGVERGVSLHLDPMKDRTYRPCWGESRLSVAKAGLMCCLSCVLPGTDQPEGVSALSHHCCRSLAVSCPVQEALLKGQRNTALGTPCQIFWDWVKMQFMLPLIENELLFLYLNSSFLICKMHKQVFYAVIRIIKMSSMLAGTL